MAGNSVGTMNIIFLDIDGVLNCQLLFEKNVKEVKKELKKQVKKEQISRDDYYKEQLCSERISWLNDLCRKAYIKVVISSTWRKNKTVEQLQTILNNSGATFEIIGFTPDLRHEGCVRGNEIHQWIQDNKELLECSYYDFHSYAIIDDDSDMLLWQKENFFQTDGYAGLTPNTCYKVLRHFQKLGTVPACH